MESIKIEIIRGIAKVRRSGVTNMYDRKRVLEEISMNCSQEIKDYIKDHENDYLELLKLSGDY